MKQARFVLIALLCGAGSETGGFGQSKPRGVGGISQEAQAWLRGTIAKGSLTDLRWPDFSDYRKQVAKFYEFNDYSLWWVKGMAPTPAAQQTIAVLLQAAEKGLSADDYDGARWSDRLAKLKPGTRQPSDADAVKFDLALTVSAMRYISDLHIGRVNPKRLDFAFDDDSKKYDLAAFLKDQIAGARDVPGALAQVEPPYPGYRRTIQALRTYMELAKKDDGEQLPAIKGAIVAGQTYAGLQRLVRLLRLLGDLPANVSVPEDRSIYDGPLVDAVKSFQRRHG